MVVVAELEPADVDRLFHALADATRRNILERAITGERSVSALARAYAISLPAVQKHVAVLERAGLVRKVRVGAEQRVHAEPARICVVRDLLETYETLWRHRVAAMDALLDEARDDEHPGGADRRGPETKES